MYFSLADQMVLYYGFAHCSVKWWKRVFFHILDTCIVNAHMQCLAGNSQLEFRRAVAEWLLADYEAAKVRHRAQDPHLPHRLKEWAFPEPFTENSWSDCHVCSRSQAPNSTIARYARHPSACIPALKSTIHSLTRSRYYSSLLLPSL